ncbi:hypothetical protein DPMN_137040 [Dreissena polymorpha]|uniref:Uncharacterized protein n=1 Tax=Dreissena polymorpha TaxID=45954 RepID=A0A9D4JHA9_DREPO|nr:hypothetical protein DPMN_137040 [Dreissena polymorpha]
MLKLAQKDRPTDRPTDRAKTILYLREKAPPLGGHVFHDIIGTLYRVLKRFFESRTIAPTDNRSNAKFDKADRATVRPIKFSGLSGYQKKCPTPPDFIWKNVLTKFHEVWTINVASRLFTRQMLTPHNTHSMTAKRRSKKLTISTLCSVALSSYNAFSVMDSSSSSKKPSSSAVGDDSSCRDGLCFFCTPLLSHSLLGIMPN